MYRWVESVRCGKFHIGESQSWIAWVRTATDIVNVCYSPTVECRFHKSSSNKMQWALLIAQYTGATATREPCVIFNVTEHKQRENTPKRIAVRRPINEFILKMWIQPSEVAPDGNFLNSFRAYAKKKRRDVAVSLAFATNFSIDLALFSFDQVQYLFIFLFVSSTRCASGWYIFQHDVRSLALKYHMHAN